jgi:hypothetical protein
MGTEGSKGRATRLQHFLNSRSFHSRRLQPSTSSDTSSHGSPRSRYYWHSTKALTNGTISEDPTERFAETIAQKVEWIRHAAGERFDEIDLSMVIFIELTCNRHQRAAQIAHERGWSGISTEQILEMPSMLIGSIDQITEKIQTLREKYAFSYFVISDKSLETFAPIVTLLAGK